MNHKATPVSGSDHSGTITAGATAQQIVGADMGRQHVLFQNNSDTDMWINFGATAVASQPSLKILAGGSYENPANVCFVGAISVICATTGKAFTCKTA